MPASRLLPVPQVASQPQTAAAASLARGQTSRIGCPNLIAIKSPMIRDLYRRASPDKPNLVEIGDEVAPAARCASLRP